MSVLLGRVAFFCIHFSSTYGAPRNNHTQPRGHMLSASIAKPELPAWPRDDWHAHQRTGSQRGDQHHPRRKNDKHPNGMARLTRKEIVKSSPGSPKGSAHSIAQVSQRHDTSSSGETKIDLSGGTGGVTGETTYTAPDGTVVESSKPVYNNQDYYFMANLFDGSTPDDLTTCGKGTGNAGDQHTCYWMTQGGSQHTDAEAVDVTLTITFPSAKHLTKVSVRPRAMLDNDNRYSTYKIETAPTAGGALTERTSGFVDTSAMVAPHTEDTAVNDDVLEVKFTLTQEDRYGCTLEEIELYEDPDAGGMGAQSTGKKESLAAPSAHPQTFGWALMACALAARACLVG